MSRAPQRGGEEDRIRWERAQFAAELEELTPEGCRGCLALSFLATRLTTRVVSGDIEPSAAVEMYEEGASLCPRLANAALHDVARPDCNVDDQILHKYAKKP